MSARTEVATSWPAVGSLVRVGAEASHLWLGPQGRASRVEDLSESAIAIAVPRGPGDVEPPDEGEELELRWVGARGLQVLPVRLSGRARDGVALWWCEPVGSVLLQQRRAYVRAPAAPGGAVRVLLSPAGSDDDGGGEPATGAAAEGRLVDLSEGGLRARVTGWDLGEDVAVLVTVTLPDGGGEAPATGAPRLVLRGRALRGREPGGATALPGVLDVSVCFDQPVPRADELRRLVFAWQRAERRAGRS